MVTGGSARLPASLSYSVGFEGERNATTVGAIGRALYVGAVVGAGVVVLGLALLSVMTTTRTRA